MAELFALMSEDPEGRLRLQRCELHKFTTEAKGRTKNHRPVQPGSGQDLHATLYEFRGGPLEDDPSSMDP